MRFRSTLFAFLSILAALAACSDDPAASGPGGTTPPGGSPPGSSSSDAGTDPESSTPPPPPDPLVNTTTEAVDVDGVVRSYVLSVPKSYDPARAYPLIVALHGDGGNAASFVSGALLEPVTGSDAILAYPDGSIDIFTPYDQNTDQKMVERIITAVRASHSIDASKIRGYGYSKGAYQLNELACRRPGLFSAMAIHAGGAPQERDIGGNVDCPLAIGIAMFVVHGERDTPAGGEFAANYWASRAGCDATRSASTPSMCQAYDNCDGATPVVFCVVPGHGHSPLYGGAGADTWAWFQSL